MLSSPDSPDRYRDRDRFKDSKDSRPLARVKDSKKFSGFWCFSAFVAKTFVAEKISYAELSR